MHLNAKIFSAKGGWEVADIPPSLGDRVDFWCMAKGRVKKRPYSVFFLNQPFFITYGAKSTDIAW